MKQSELLGFSNANIPRYIEQHFWLTEAADGLPPGLHAGAKRARDALGL